MKKFLSTLVLVVSDFILINISAFALLIIASAVLNVLDSL